MTFDEKITILSMKFSSIWYRLWRYDPEANYTGNKRTDEETRSAANYFNKKTKFETIFLVDGGKRLQRLINNSFNAVTPWEIPKGKLNNKEASINGALREFEEETGVYSDKHTLIWDAKPVIVSHKDENIKYKYIYYISYFNKNNTWEPKINFGSTQQVSEIEQVKWINLNDIQFLNLNPSNKNHLINTYKKIEHSFKHHIKSYYYE
jgi:8-oxo-dGTP pyrophosphatase MutT (NUDIX family)